MEGNKGETQIESERELYKYINHQAGTTKASTRNILVHMYSIFRLLLLGVSDYSSSESCKRRTKNDRVHCYYFTEGCL